MELMLGRVRGRPETLRHGAAWRISGGIVVLGPHRVCKGSGTHEVTATRMTRHAVKRRPGAAWGLLCDVGDSVVVVVMSTLRKEGSVHGGWATGVTHHTVCMGPGNGRRVGGWGRGERSGR